MEGGKRGGREEENKVAGGEGERGGQKGELVHAMIMVMNHKSHNIAENKINQNSQTKGKINNNPSHKEHEILPFPPMHSKHTNHHGGDTFSYRIWYR